MKKIGVLLIIFCCLILAAPFEGKATSKDLMSAAGVQAINEDLRAPNIKLKDLAGKSVKLKDYRGRVVMLFFYATW